MYENTKDFLSELIDFLRKTVPNNDFDAIAEIVNKYSEKKIKGKKVYFFWKKENVVYKWVIKAFLLASIEKGWSPENNKQSLSLVNTLVDEPTNTTTATELKKEIESYISNFDASKITNKTISFL